MRRFLVKQAMYLQDSNVVAEGVMFTEGHVVAFDLYNASITICKSIEDYSGTIEEFFLDIEWIDQVEEASE